VGPYIYFDRSTDIHINWIPEGLQIFRPFLQICRFLWKSNFFLHDWLSFGPIWLRSGCQHCIFWTRWESSCMHQYPARSIMPASLYLRRQWHFWNTTVVRDKKCVPLKSLFFSVFTQETYKGVYYWFVLIGIRTWVKIGQIWGVMKNFYFLENCAMRR
jgi:hypothetical protein